MITLAFMNWLNEGNKLFQEKRYQQAIECWEKALEIGEEKKNDRVISNAAMNIGTVYSLLEEWDIALKYFQKSLEIEKKQGNKSGITEGYMKIGDMFFERGQWEVARDNYEQSIRVFVGENYNKARIFLNIGLTLFFDGNWKQAIESYKQSLEIFKELKNLEGISKVLVNLGIAARNLGNWEEAIGYFEESLEMDQKLGDKYGNATCLMNIGIALEVLGRIKEAIQYYQQSFNIFREIEDNEGVAMCLLNMGNAFQSIEKWDKSLDFYKRSLNAFESLGDQLNVSKCLTNIGIVLRNLGNWDEAISNYQKSIAWFEKENDLAALSKCLLDLGVAYYSTGKKEQAIKYMQQSREMFQQLGDRPGEALACQNLGWVYQEQKKVQLAFKCFNEALGIYITLITPISSDKYRQAYEKEFEALPKIIDSLTEMLNQPTDYTEIKEPGEGVESMNQLLSELQNNVSELSTAIKAQGIQDISKNISGLMNLVNKTLATFTQSEKLKSEKISSNILDSIKVCRLFFQSCESCNSKVRSEKVLQDLSEVRFKLEKIFPEFDLVQRIQDKINQVREESSENFTDPIALELKFQILMWIKRLYSITLSNKKIYLETLPEANKTTSFIESELSDISKLIEMGEKKYSAEVLEYMIIIKKKSGIPIFRWNFTQLEATYNADLVSGFLSAISTFGSEISGERLETSMQKLAYKNFEINFADGKYIRVALILRGALTELLAKQLGKFVSNFEIKFDEPLKIDTGRFQAFKEADSLVKEYFTFIT